MDNKDRNNNYYYDKTENDNNNQYNFGENNNHYDFGESSGSYNDSYGDQRINIKEVMDGAPKSRGWSVASLVLSIVSVVCCCFSVAGIVFGALSILFAVISRINLGYFDGLSIGGLIVGIFGVVFGVAGIVAIQSIDFDAIMEEFWAEYNNAIEGGNDINGSI